MSYKIKNKNVLVTGGAGFIGSHLVDKLVEHNNVLVIDDFSLGTKDRLHNASKSGRLKIVKEDIRNLKAMEKLLKNIDVVFHLAARCVRISLYDPLNVHDVNGTGALNLYIAAHKNRVERFVHISSSEVYGSAIEVPMKEEHQLNPTTVYGASKLAGEMYGRAYFRTYQMPVIVIRPFNTYGPRSHFAGPYGEVIPRFVIRALNNLPPVVFGDGKQTRDFTYVIDTAKGIIMAAEEDKLVGEVVNIAYGRERSILEVADIVLKTLGKESLVTKFLKPRPGDVFRHYADVAKAKKILKYKAETSLEEGVKLYVDWIKKQKIDLKQALKLIAVKNW